MKDAVTMLLVHARVNVETRVAELGDLLGQQLDSLCRVAEDDRLVDLQLSAHNATRSSIHTVTYTTPLVRHMVATLQSPPNSATLRLWTPQQY